MKISQRVKRAREEIGRCHIAIRRLYTTIYDEAEDFEKTLCRLRTGDPLIYGAVYDSVTRRQQVNGLLLARLKILTDSPDHSGDCSRGVRVGSRETNSRRPGDLEQVSVDGGWVAGGVDHDDNDDNDEELGIDETDELVGQLVDYVGDLALLP